jgi:hypothetical protein
MPFKFDQSTFDAIAKLAETFDQHPMGAMLVVAVILACGLSVAIARHSLRHRRRASGSQTS